MFVFTNSVIYIF